MDSGDQRSLWADRSAVADTFRRFMLFADKRDWDRVGDTLADVVLVDTTELFGGEAKAAPRADVVASLRGALSGFRATHHMMAGEVVEIRGDDATLDVYANERFELTSTVGASSCALGGRYAASLARDHAGVWRIRALRFHLAWADGNPDLFRRAALAFDATTT